MSSSSSSSKPSFPPGTNVAGWKVIRKIGSGGFGAVYEVERQEDGQRGALKAEFIREDHSESLRNEVAQLRILQWSKHFCRLFLACKAQLGDRPFNMMIMSLVGKSLSSLRKQCPGAKFTKETAFRLAVQCLQAIEDLHSVGVINRDVKASNFAWSEERRVYMLDLGFCRRFIELDITGKAFHRKQRKNCHFMGTTKYCSLNAYNRKEQSRRDDLWCFLYMFVEFVVGYLTWANDSDFRTALKKQQIGSSLLNKCPVEMYAIYDHIRMLEYESKPNYSMMKAKMNSFISSCSTEGDYIYDWEEGGTHFEYMEEAKRKEEEKEERRRKEREERRQKRKEAEKKPEDSFHTAEAQISGDSETKSTWMTHGGEKSSEDSTDNEAESSGCLNLDSFETEETD